MQKMRAGRRRLRSAGKALSPIARGVRYWVVKGNERLNDLDEMLRPGVVERWITKRPPRAWSPGDRVFFWKSSPSLRLVGLGVIEAIDPRRDREGYAPFHLKYLSRSLGESGPRIDALRGDEQLASASFLKAGAAGTVFPLTDAQAMRLGKHLSTKDREIDGVLAEWFSVPPRKVRPGRGERPASPLPLPIGAEWSRPLGIVTVMTAFGLPAPNQRLSQRQFREMLTVLTAKGVELKLSKGEAVLSMDSPSPGINSRVRLRTKASRSAPKLGIPKAPVEIIHHGATSENALEHLFVVPLLLSLGYIHEDLSPKHGVQVSLGAKRVAGKADFAVFGGKERTDCLMVVEAKRPLVALSDAHRQQALSYAASLNAVYCMVTNGDEILVLKSMDPILCFFAKDIEARWHELHGILNKSAAIASHRERKASSAKVMFRPKDSLRRVRRRVARAVRRR